MQTKRKNLIDKDYFLIDFIRRNREASRNQITKFFNMNATTVGNIIQKLLEEGIIVEALEDDVPDLNTAGRPPIPLRLNSKAAYFIGVNFSGDNLCAVLADFTGAPVKTISREFFSPSRKDDVLRILNEAIKELIETANVPREKLEGIGIGVPGTVNTITGCAIKYSRIRGWSNMNLADLFGPVYCLPVFVEHNSGCFALGEINLGCARQYSNIVNIVIRTGISMGVIRGREIFSLTPVSAGELGHMTINPKGPRCWCGNKGCLETVFSGWALEKKLQKAVKKGEITSVLTPEEFCLLARTGDTFATSLLGEMFDSLGIAVGDIGCLLRPEAIVINGYFNAAEEFMGERIRKHVKERMGDDGNLPEIIISSHGDSIGACGAAIMAASRLYNPLCKISDAVSR